MDEHSLHEHLLSTPEWIALDPHTWLPDEFKIEKRTLSKHTVVRIQPMAQGRRILGADVAISLQHESLKWNMVHIQAPKVLARHAKRSFSINYSKFFNFKREERIRQVMGSMGKAHVEEIWYQKDGALVPAWAVYDPNGHPADRKLIYIDAIRGTILATIPMVKHDKGYVFPPTYASNYHTMPAIMDLDEVNSTSTANGGYSIRGTTFRSFNSCFAYKCANGTGENGACDMDGSICVDPLPGMIRGKDYFTSSYNFSMDGRYLDFDRDWPSDGYKDYTIYMRWDKNMVFAPRLKKPESGIWASDIDFGSYSIANQSDTFAELQAYKFFTAHMSFMKSLINDSNFCILGTGPGCTTVDPRTNRTATKLDYPIAFTVNLQTLKMSSSNSQYPSFYDQLNQGLGKNASSPILFYEHDNYGEAYYTYSPYQPPANGSIFPDCLEGTCISINDSPLDFFAFGQGPQSDWALNNCIVFHELTHAFVQKYLPYLPSYVWTSQGLSSEPGALNEAWADYFAAIHCGFSNFLGTYNGHPLRNLNNDFTCRDYVGEVHVDSQVFSGALWKIRNAIPTFQSLSAIHQTLFDQLVFHAITLGHSTENFTSQFNIILGLLSQDSKLKALVPLAQSTFELRVLNCTKVTEYKETMDSTFHLPTAQLTSANVSTLPNQIRIAVRPSDWGLELKWGQWFVSPILGTLNVGYARSPFQILISSDCPISINGSSSSNLKGIKACSGSNQELLTWQNTEYDAKTRTGRLSYYFLPGSTEAIYLFITHQVPAEMIMYSTSLTFYGWNRIWLFTLAVTGCLWGLLALLSLFLGACLTCATCVRLRRYEPPAQSEATGSRWIDHLLINEPCPFRAKVLAHIIVTGLLYAGSAVAAIVGLMYNPSLAYLPGIAFLPAFLITLGDVLLWIAVHRFTMIRSNRFWGSVLAIGWIFLFFSVLGTFSSFAALGVTFSFQSGLWAHAFVYVIYASAWTGRLISFFLFISQLKDIVN